MFNVIVTTYEQIAGSYGKVPILPRVGLLVRCRRSYYEFVVEMPPDDLQPDWKPAIGPAGRDGRGRLASEIDRERKFEPVEEPDAPTFDSGGAGRIDAERRHC